MSKLEKEVVGFSFQEIPLEEALNVVLAGDGNYSEIKQTLLEKLPLLGPGKAFAFGLPGGKEVPEESRRGLCMAINATLKRAKMNWRVTYSGTKKMFICIPKTLAKTAPSKAEGHVPRSKYNKTDDIPQVLQLRDQGMKLTDIAAQTGIDIERLRYISYQLYPRRSYKGAKPGPKPVVKSNGHMTADHLVELAKKTLNYSGNFQNGDGKAARKAISMVGFRDFGIRPKELAPHLGITPDGVYFNAKLSDSKFGKSEIEALRKAIKQEG